jgi:hypothetical protein
MRKKNKKSDAKGSTGREVRFCEYCGDPLPLISKITRKHCEYSIVNGVIKDCKTAKARQNDKAEREFFQKLKSTIKGIDGRIKKMLIEKGNVVDLQDLEAYDIHLNKALHRDFKCDGQLICTYLNYIIHGNPITEKFQIIPL